MKQLVAILLIMTIGSLTAKSELRLIVPYSIISDSVSVAVPEGYTMIKGIVQTNDTSVVRKGIVSNYDMTNKTKVKDGSFRFLVPDSDSIVFFYSEAYGEIVITPYDFQSGHEVTIYFYVFEAGMMMNMDKPVIYCYSEEPLTATINLAIKGELSFSYPAYNAGWKVDVDESGILTTSNGKSYPYLFWEGKTNNLNFQSNQNGSIDGFFIQTDSIINFLEAQLYAIGLNRQEQTDFITYWAPRIISEEYAFIQFLVDEKYASTIAGINISPHPDHLRRVFMLYTPLSESPNLIIHPQSFEPEKREGFTVIEWGGSELSLNPIQL